MSAEPVDTAWNIHSAIMQWTSTVDSKATFVSAIETAIFVAVIAATENDRLFDNLNGFWQVVPFWIGIVALGLSLLCVLYVVRPRLRHRKVKNEKPDNYIFFGHARQWKADDLAKALVNDPLPMLSRQIVETSKIAWTKHRLLQFSVEGTVFATVMFLISAWANH